MVTKNLFIPVPFDWREDTEVSDFISDKLNMLAEWDLIKNHFMENRFSIEIKRIWNWKRWMFCFI